MLGEESALGRVWGLEEDGRFHDVLVRHPDAVALTDLEREAAPADPLRLILDLLEAPAADWNAHFDEPVIEIAAEFDVTRAGSETLGWKPQQKEPRARAVWNTNWLRFSLHSFAHAGF